MNINKHPLRYELEAALDWWRMAGVDCDFSDYATDWLSKMGSNPDAQAGSTKGVSEVSLTGSMGAENLKKDAPGSNIRVERVDLLGPNPPQDLAAFREWWLTAPGLDAIGTRGRVAPRGPYNPELMVLVIDPEQNDDETVLSGPQGRLLKRIITAMGLNEEAVYFASALPRHTPMADTAALAASGMDEITQFHVNLVSPQRLLAFGAGIPPLLGHALTNDLSLLREINQTKPPIPLLVTEGLDAMMAMPRLKARFWRRWVEWSAKETR
ncbi:MAG: hypothetical protein AAGI28_13835 [Pseudomonadota bacterium]